MSTITRRTLSTMISLVLLLSSLLVFTVSAAGVVGGGDCGAEGDNVRWTLYDDGFLDITGTGATADYTPRDVPWYTVTSSDAPWYSVRQDITGVRIGGGVTTIGDGAFYDCQNLQTVYYLGTLKDWGQMSVGRFNDVLLDVERYVQMPQGDVSGDGAVTVADYGLALSHVRGVKPLTDDALLATDISGDGEVTVADYGLILAHVRGVKELPLTMKLDKRNSNGKLIVGGRDITAESYVYFDEARRGVALPLTAIMKELGATVEWQDETTVTITAGEHEWVLNTAEPFFGLFPAPGSTYGVRKMIGNDVIVDDTTARAPVVSCMGVHIQIDYDKKIVEIG